MVAIFPKLCLWRRSLCSNLGGIGPGKLYRTTLIDKKLLCVALKKFIHKHEVQRNVSVLFSSNKGRGAHLLFSPNGGAYLRAALMRVNMVTGNVPSLRARISAAALINFLSQLLRLF